MSQATQLTTQTLDTLRCAELRAAAAAAVARGEAPRLLLGKGLSGERVETLLLVAEKRAGQSSGGNATWGQWIGERLHSEAGGHMLDANGTCWCPSCEMAAGYWGDDAE